MADITLIDVNYHGNPTGTGMQLSASWEKDGTFKKYVMYLTRTSGTITKTINSPDTTSGTMDISPPLLPGETNRFYVEGELMDGTFVESVHVSPLELRPEITSAIFDGDRIITDWTPVYRSTVAGYRLECTSPDEGTVGQAIIDDPLTTSVVLPLLQELHTGTQYKLSLCTIPTGIVRSCADEVPVVVERPMLTAVTYDGNRIEADWIPVAAPEPPVVSYTLSCHAPGGGDPITHTIPGSSAATGGIILPAPLDPNLPYRFTVLANSAGASSSASPEEPLLAALPEFTDILLDGSNVTARWAPLSNAGAPVTALTLTCRTTDGVFVYNKPISPTDATSGTVAITDPINPGLDYEVFLTAEAGPVVHARSAAMPLVTIAPTLTHVAYDGRVIAADWGAITISRVPVTGFTLRAYPMLSGPEFTAVIAGHAAASGTITLPSALDPGLGYKFTVATNSAASRAVSAPVMLVSQLPALLKATYDGREVRAEWTPSLDPRIENVTLDCFSTDGSESFSVLLPDPMAGTGTLPLTAGLDIAKTYLFRICANVGTVLSGCTTAVELLTVLPALTAASYDRNDMDAEWTWAPNESGTGFILRIYSPDQPGMEFITEINDPIARNGSVSAPALPDVARWYLELTATGLGGVGVATQPLELIVVAPIIGSTAYDGRAIDFTWGLLDEPTVTHYECEVYDGDIVVARSMLAESSAQPGMGSGWIAAPLAGTRSYRMRIRGRGGVVGGPLGPAIMVIGTTPVIAQATTEAGNVVARVENQDLHGVPDFTYEAAIFLDDIISSAWIPGVGGPDWADVIIPFTPIAGRAYTVRGRIVGLAGMQITGPSSHARGLINGIPAITAASYDGTTVHVAWTPLEERSLTGYVVHLIEEGAPDPEIYETDGSSIAITRALAPNLDYQVRVRGAGNMALGMLSAPANPVADAVGFFLPDKATSQYPYIFRGDIRGPEPHQIVMHLPDIFASPLGAPIDMPPFNLGAFNPAQPGFPYQLTVQWPNPIDIWHFTDNKIRENLRTAFVQFLEAIESAPAGLRPGGLGLVRQVLANGLPLNFEETLYYSLGLIHYLPGLPSGSGHIDLAPGMRLRIDYEQYQIVPGASVTLGESVLDGLSGFTGAGTSVYDIGRQTTATGSVITTFNSLFTRMPGLMVAPNTGGAGGVIDLHGGAYDLPYFRLVYPPNFPSSDGPTSINPNNNILIVGGPTFSRLEAATDHYLQYGNLDGFADTVSAFFRGRAVIFPEIPCTIDGQLLYVPAGTTVRQLLDRYAPTPFAPTLAISGITYQRSIGNLVDDPATFATPGAAFPAARTNPIHFDFSTLGGYTYPEGLDCFDLPVLPGDSLTINR